MTPTLEPATDRRRAAERMALAVHEAAHAVTALALGWSVRSASTIADDESSGRVDIVPPVPVAGLAPDVARAITRQQLIERCTIFAAGVIAQRKAVPRSKASGSYDAEVIARLVRMLAGSPAAERAMLRFVTSEARASVENNWAAIAAVATALQERDGFLDGLVIRAIFDDVNGERAREVQQHIAVVGMPSNADLDDYEVERNRRDRRVERRDLAAGILSSVLDSLADGNTAHITGAAAEEAIRRHAGRVGLDADLAVRKMQHLIDDRRARLRWRAVA